MASRKMPFLPRSGKLGSAYGGPATHPEIAAAPRLMKWGVKIAAFKALSLIPGGSRWYRWAQENITNSLVPTPERVSQKISVGLRYARFLHAHGLENRLQNGRHLDLGSGWHPTIPLLFHCLGCPHQSLADVVPVMTSQTARQTATTFLKVLDRESGPLPIIPDRRTQIGALSWDPWPPAALPWEYHAPYMRWLSSVPASFDLVTSTQALLHVPRPVLREIFTSVAHAMKPGGVFMGTIHLHDLFADSDRSITPYNHLRYSPWFWEKVISSPLMAYNRLKGPDYRQLLLESGWRILTFEVDPGTPNLLATIKIHPYFRHLSREDLAATHLFFAAQKP